MTNIQNLSKISENTTNSEMELVLDQLHAVVFVCNLETFEILYTNKYANMIHGIPKEKKCWEWINPGALSPCSECHNKELSKLKGKIYVHDHYNQFDDKWYEVQEKIIIWKNGQTAKLSISYDINHRKDDEKKLLNLYKQQELFSKISEAFNKQASFAKKVNNVLGLVGKFINVDRISIFKNHQNSNSINLSYEWCNEGIDKKIDKIKQIKFDKENIVFDQIIKNGILNTSDINDSEFKNSLNVFKKFNVRSLLVKPTFLHNKHRGFVTFEACKNIRIWRKNEIQLIETFANIISTTFERKRIEENRIRSEHNLRDANATKDKFFKIITRDLLSPFSDISSLSSILVDSYERWDDDKRLKFIKSIKESAQNGYKLLDNLITWSKVQSGQMEYYQQEVDIRSVLNLTIEQLKKQAESKNISINGIPKDFVFVLADYLMLNTIFKNLINNAIKYSPKNGQIDIALKNDTKFLEVKICDKGIGIEKQHLNSLFKIDLDNYSFGPLESKGTGLGLIICREFVEKNGGQIWVESQVGIGSCFTFTIPLPNKKV